MNLFSTGRRRFGSRECAIGGMAILFIILPGIPFSSARPGSGPPIFELMDEVRRIEAIPHWPGFEPRTIPAALFDGQNTYLFDFPGLPDGYRPVSGHSDALVFSGRHPAVLGNRRVQLEGVWVATSIPNAQSVLSGNPASLAEIAAVILHEKFHVFQALRHPDWKPNDMALFDYPQDTVESVVLRRMEMEAFRRAVSAAAKDEIGGWARAALNIRSQRLAGLSARHSRYERELQRLEGLAEFIEFQAGGMGILAAPPIPGFAPNAVREMGYTEGRWIGVLLERLDTGWPDGLESGQFSFLEERLETVLRGGPEPRHFLPDELRAIRETAVADLRAKDIERARLAAEFESGLGTAIEFIPEGDPLHVEMFDPFNVEAVGAGKMIHRQWLILKNANGVIQVCDRPCLTEINDRNQVVRLVIPGFPKLHPLFKWQNNMGVGMSGVVAAFRDVRVSERSKRFLVFLKKPAFNAAASSAQCPAPVGRGASEGGK
jgi:hypothetical protein